MVLTIVVHVAPPLVDDSHLITRAEFPLKVKVPPIELVQAVVTAGEIVPPIGEGFTVTVVEAILLQPLVSVTVKEYVPDAAVVTLAIEGF